MSRAARAAPATPSRVGVIALQGDVREHLVILERLGALGVEVRRPADLEGIDALVLPGGESTTMSLLLESSGLTTELEKLVAHGLPMLGTCAGMILLAAEILDGRDGQVCFGAIDLAVRRNGFGRQAESFETDLEVDGLTDPVHAVFIRAPIVERTGKGVRVMASIKLDGEERPVVCQQGPVIVSAFHPELADDVRLHELLLSSAIRTSVGNSDSDDRV